METLKGLIALLAVFGGGGYFCGAMFRDVGFWKLVAIFVLVPGIIGYIMLINDLVWVTLPFLTGMALGFAGPKRIKRGLILASDKLHEFRHQAK